MDATAKMLSLDPAQSSHVSRLNKQIDIAKTIMTKVIHPCLNNPILRYPLLYTLQKNQERELLLDHRRKV
jgi:hypothetical protein